MARRKWDGPKVLVWHGKHGNDYWDASGDNELGAFLAMFQMLDENQCYYELDEGWAEFAKERKALLIEIAEIKSSIAGLPKSLVPASQAALHSKEREYSDGNATERQREYYLSAKMGSAQAARDLIGERNDYEYERYELQPLNPPAKVKVKA